MEGRVGQLGLAEVAAHHAGAGDDQLADRPRRDVPGRLIDDRAHASGGQTVPIGNGASAVVGIVLGIGCAVQTLVSVGP